MFPRFLSPAASRWLWVIPALLLLPGCERIKAKINSVLSRTQATTDSSDSSLTPEEQAMNKMLDDPKLFEAKAAADEAKPAPLEINKSAIVSILGYHDFRDRGGTTMLIAEPKFRQQMQAIKDSKIPVIPLSDVLAWKRGEKNIPEESIVITMDDGWVGVYQHAYPVLKEFGFPFTIYLYKKYVNIGGRSMTWDQIKEMMAHGCEVGSHTVSHEALTKKGGRNDNDYQLWLLSELKDSKDFLEQHLGVKVPSVAYPYGNRNELIEQLALQVGYEAGITVNGAKNTFTQQNIKLNRFIIYGHDDTAFRMATSFRTRGGDLSGGKAIPLDAKAKDGQPLVELTPAPNSTITERRPLIQANLLRLGSIVPESVKVRVSGFGVVPAQFDKKTFILSYQLPSKLRREDCVVSITFKRDLEKSEELITWKFKIDLAAAYVPQETVLPAAPLPAPAAPPSSTAQ